MAEYTEQQLIGALRKADAAGDTDAARAIAKRIQAMRQSAQPDFSNVQARSSNTISSAGAPGQMLSTAPSALAAPGQGTMRVRGAVGEQDLAAEDANRAKMFGELPLPARVAIGAGSSVARIGRGAAQIAGLPVNEERARHIDSAIDADNAGKAGAIGADVTMAAIPLSRIGALGKAGQYGASVGAGATMAGVQPVVDGESRAQNAAIGGGLGLLGQGASDILIASGKRAAQAVAPEMRALYQKAKQFGIELTPAQLSDSEFMKRAVAMFDKMPLSGAANRQARQNEAGNTALARLLGVEDSKLLDARTFDRALSQIGDKFDEAFSGGMRYDSEFLRNLVALRQEAESQMDDTAIRTINGWIERVRSQGQDGAISGRTLQSLDESARRAATGGGDRQAIAQEFRNVLHDAFGKSAPAGVRATWDEARRQYATAMQLLPLVAKNPNGGVPLAQLQGAITVGNKAKRARARGRDGDLGVLASVGQLLKGPTSSGTAENALASQALNPLAWPVIGLGALFGRSGNAAINNSVLARYLMSEGRGQTRQAAAPYIRGAGLASATPLTAKERADKKRKGD